MRFEDMVLEISGAGRERPPMPLPEAIIHRMKDVASLHQRNKCLFAIGALVTPRKGGVLSDRMVGIPSLVIATKTPEYDWNGNVGTPRYGCQLDMRVLIYDRDSDGVMPLWVDSADYEQYVAEKTKEAADVA